MPAKKKTTKKENSISSEARLKTMLKESEDELAKIEPEIEKLQKKVDRLNELKLTKQKLITLKLSLKSILSNYDNSDKEVSKITESSVNVTSVKSVSNPLHQKQPFNHPFPNALFLPDKAFEDSSRLLKRKNSLNYDIFRAIVFSGGQATTEEIRNYLIENNVKMPGSGKSIREVPLTDISSRANYLVRRGVVAPADRGLFVSNFGWEESSAI